MKPNKKELNSYDAAESEEYESLAKSLEGSLIVRYNHLGEPTDVYIVTSEPPATQYDEWGDSESRRYRRWVICTSPYYNIDRGRARAARASYEFLSSAVAEEYGLKIVVHGKAKNK